MPLSAQGHKINEGRHGLGVGCGYALAVDRDPEPLLEHLHELYDAEAVEHAVLAQRHRVVPDEGRGSAEVTRVVEPLDDRSPDLVAGVSAASGRAPRVVTAESVASIVRAVGCRQLREDGQRPIARLERKMLRRVPGGERSRGYRARDDGHRADDRAVAYRRPWLDDCAVRDPNAIAYRDRT